MYDIFLISDDVVGTKMAGPGIRAWELSKCLAKHFKVILAIPDYSFKNGEEDFVEKTGFEVTTYSVDNPAHIENIGKQSQIILVQGYILSKFPALKNLDAHLIVDLYVPFPLENLFVHQQKISKLTDREFIHQKDLRVFNDQIIAGDHFLCASERQKDLFTGSLMSLNRINPEILDLSPNLDKLISVIPFGISEQGKRKPEDTVLRNKIPGISDHDVLFLWGGVLTNWFDPITLIKAFHEASKENPNIKLYFLSTQHPNPLLPEFDMAREAMEIAKELGQTDKSVFFNTEWVDYNKRHLYFQEADVGISIHKTHFETRFAFRTRMLDYIKHHLPIICTEGDYFSELVEKEKLGIVVRSQNEDDIKNAILNLAAIKNPQKRMSRNVKKIKSQFYWEKVAEPLVQYCRDVLGGDSGKKSGPDRAEIAYITSVKKDWAAKKVAKKHLWVFVQKLPFNLGTKIKRLFKFMG